MAAEIWIVSVIKIAFIIVGGHIAITKIVPLLNDFLLSMVKEKEAINSFTSLIDIFILTLVGYKIVELVLTINNNILNYISVLGPGFEVVLEVFKYLQWILLALIVAVALKRYKV